MRVLAGVLLLQNILRAEGEAFPTMHFGPLPYIVMHQLTKCITSWTYEEQLSLALHFGNVSYPLLRV
jgi:hypothetical protein